MTLESSIHCSRIEKHWSSVWPVKTLSPTNLKFYFTASRTMFFRLMMAIHLRE